MSRVIAYDLARLFLGPLSATPRGIDRIDLALAEHFFPDSESIHLGILPTPWGVRAFPSRIVRRGLDHLKKLWAEDVDTAKDTQLTALTTKLSGVGQALPVLGSRELTIGSKARRMLRHLRVNGLAAGHSALRHVPEGAIYLNVGQIGLAVPLFHKWLKERPDLACFIMLHDVIPLEYPQYVHPRSVPMHQKMVDTAAQRADCLITTTRHADQRIADALGVSGRSNIKTYTRSLPLPEAFTQTTESLPELENIHYFLACSSIEPRKNFNLLIQVWQSMLARSGADAPHLIIVGRRGWRADEILAPIDNNPALRSRVHHISGLSSPALARLVLGASGMLCPSLAEGFGLTVLEANALGVPTIASDIAAHREIANTDTLLLPPNDVDAWIDAILSMPTAGIRHRPPIPVAVTERAYCQDIEIIIRSFMDA